MRLTERLHQPRFDSPAHEAMLELLVTASWIQRELGRRLSLLGLTTAQYNLLRILRGSHPAPLNCAAIGERLIEQTPDVTRLLDRLQKAGLLTRGRAKFDRRVVQVTITGEGLELLARADPEVEGFIQDNIAAPLTPDQLHSLIGVLEEIRQDEAPPVAVP